MKGYRVRYLDEATTALREATAYIAEQGGRDRAREWLLAMLNDVDALETMPFAFPRATVLDGRAIYSKVIPPYRVYYTVDDVASTVYVIDVVHTARDTQLRKYRPE